MKFDFRKALVNLSEEKSYLETPIGYAEWFLKRAIHEMVCKNISFEEIGELYLGLAWDYERNDVQLFISYVAKDKVQKQKFWEQIKEIPEKINHSSIFYTYIGKYPTPLENDDYGTKVIAAIEKELKDENFICEDIASLHRKRDPLISSYIKITF